jgi:hypothetical protein
VAKDDKFNWDCWRKRCFGEDRCPVGQCLKGPSTQRELAKFWRMSVGRVKKLIGAGLQAGRANEFMYLAQRWLPKAKSGRHERITCGHARWIKTHIIKPIRHREYMPRHPETGEWISDDKFREIEAKRSADLLARHPELGRMMQRWGIDPTAKGPPPWIRATNPVRDTSKFRPKKLRGASD